MCFMRPSFGWCPTLERERYAVPSSEFKNAEPSVWRVSVPGVRTQIHQRNGQNVNSMVVVAISGSSGTGKTTVARYLVKEFGLKYVCAGTIFRKLAEEKGMTLEEFSRYVERHPEIDRMIDRRTVEAAREKNVLIDARLAGWMAKKADVKILLTAPLEVRVRRISQREGRRHDEVLRETVVRERSERRRFKKIYGIDVGDHSSFDLILNTARLSVRETVGISKSAIDLIRRRKAEQRNGVRKYS